MNQSSENLRVDNSVKVSLQLEKMKLSKKF